MNAIAQIKANSLNKSISYCIRADFHSKKQKSRYLHGHSDPPGISKVKDKQNGYVPLLLWKNGAQILNPCEKLGLNKL